MWMDVSTTVTGAGRLSDVEGASGVPSGAGRFNLCFLCFLWVGKGLGGWIWMGGLGCEDMVDFRH